MIHLLMSGAMVALSLTITVFQLRNAKKTGDRLFLFFAVAFALMAINRLSLSLIDDESESRTMLYVVRLLAFALIIFGIWDKNRRAKLPIEH